jgi:hypothetical protein
MPKPFERPSGYFQTIDPVSFAKLEGETRQCVHCGFTWIYNPKVSFSRKLAGKEVNRGICMKCFGQTCARPECLRLGCVPLMKQIEDMEAPKKLILT